MATEAQKTMLPSMTGGQNDGGLSEYEREQLKIKAAQAAKEKADLAASIVKSGVNVAAGTPSVQELYDELKDIAQPPAPRPPAPEQETYWVDPYGAVWSKLPAPRVILTVNNYCTPKQLDAIVRLLIDNPDLEQKG